MLDFMMIEKSGLDAKYICSSIFELDVNVEKWLRNRKKGRQKEMMKGYISFMVAKPFTLAVS